MKLSLFTILVSLLVAGCSGKSTGSHYPNSENNPDQRDPRLIARESVAQVRQAQLDENRRIISELRALGVDVHDSTRGIVISLPDVLFMFGRADLTLKAVSTISQIARVIQHTQERRISVEGHTDNVGTISYNYQLSRDRAFSVAKQLSLDGISKTLIDTKGFGETEPMATNRTDHGRTQNRRVEVIIKNKGNSD